MGKFRFIGRKRLLGCRRGNVSMMTALVAGPLVILLGGAVDLMRFANVRAEMQGALDSGVLAAAAISNTRSADLIIDEYLAANVDSRLVNVDDIVTEVTPRRDVSGSYVDVSATYAMDTYFLKMLGINSMSVGASASGQQEWQAVEVSLVVDISSSMNNTKLTALKQAGKDFVDEILKDDVVDITSISLIPFGGTVNLGDDFLSYVDTSTIDSGGHDLNFSDGHWWNGCFELGVGDFDDGDFDSTSNPTVPHFWKWTDFNPWCPEDVNEAIFVSNNAGQLRTAIDGMTRSDGTGMDIGAAIGLKALSPDWNTVISNSTFPDRPTAYNSETLKALVIMTDGEITQQNRPAALQCKTYDNDPWKVDGDGKGCEEYETFGCIEANWKKKRDPDKKKIIQCEGPKPDSGKNGATAKQNFRDVCEKAKEQGIVVYTVGFQIDKTKDSHTLLGDCASSVSQYYLVEDTDIDEAFSAIAASINGVRITG